MSTIEEEVEALEAISNSENPMVRVIYHMAMRQLATSERIANIESEVVRTSEQLRRLVNILSNGSRPDLKAVVYKEG